MEHAYYLKYLNVRADYVKAMWNIINWDDVATRFEQARPPATRAPDRTPLMPGSRREPGAGIEPATYRLQGGCSSS